LRLFHKNVSVYLLAQLYSGFIGSCGISGRRSGSLCPGARIPSQQLRPLLLSGGVLKDRHTIIRCLSNTWGEENNSCAKKMAL